MNHIFRVHGNMILEEENAATTFDEVELGSLERHLLVFTEDSQEQATLSVRQTGVPTRGASLSALPGELRKPKVHARRACLSHGCTTWTHVQECPGATQLGCTCSEAVVQPELHRKR